MSLRKTTEIYCFILVDKTRYIDPKKIQDNSVCNRQHFHWRDNIASITKCTHFHFWLRLLEFYDHILLLSKVNTTVEKLSVLLIYKSGLKDIYELCRLPQVYDLRQFPREIQAFLEIASGWHCF